MTPKITQLNKRLERLIKLWNLKMKLKQNPTKVIITAAV